MKPKKTEKICKECNGDGYIGDNDGETYTIIKCNKCNGRGNL